MRIRKYMVLGMLSIVVFPWFIFFLVHFLDTHSWQPWTQAPSQHQTESMRQDLQNIAEHSANWQNPAWQQRMQRQLNHDKVQVIIRSPANRILFQSANRAQHHWMTGNQVEIVRDGRLVGTVQMGVESSGDPAAAIAALLAMVMAISFVGVQIRRNVIRPLEAMRQAAQQIAIGELDFELPTSSVVEVMEVRKAFAVMGAGLKEAFSKQARLEEERHFFIGAIAHDLRTPLFSLRGYLDGLEQGVAASKAQMAKYVAVCKEKAAHLDRLVADLFAFTKLESMEQTVHRQRIDLSNIVRRCVEGMQQIAQQNGVRLDMHVPDQECVILGDAHLLERALTNLLDNALRYTPADGVISIQLQDGANTVTVCIKDTGPGFSMEDLRHAFEPMYRGDASRNLGTGGAGLGLTIARRIFKAHKGDLALANGEAGGAVLTGWLIRDEDGAGHLCAITRV